MWWQNQPPRFGQSTRDKFNIQKTLGINRPRHEQLAFRQFLESNARIIGRITHKNDKPVAPCLGPGQAFPHEGQSNPEILPLGIHHQGTKQQGWRSRAANGKRPKTYGARHANLRIADNQGQAIGRRAAFPQAVGGFDPAFYAKGNIEQLLDEGLVGCFRGFYGK